MITTIRKSFYRNGYLLIIAAWLYTISFIFSNYLTYSSSPHRVQLEIENAISQKEKKFKQILADTLLLENLLLENVEEIKYLENTDEELGLFLYNIYDSSKAPKLSFWSNNRMLPDEKDINRPDGAYPTIHTNGYFEFIHKTVLLKGQTIVVCGMIPVYWNYGITNKYLQPKFPISDLEKRYAVATSNTDFNIKSGDGKILFWIQQKDVAKDNPSTLPLVMRILGVVFFLVWLNVVSLTIAHFNGLNKGFRFLFFSLIILRYVSYILPFPFRYRTLSLFDSTVYASNFLHPSLGDLFINVILIYWLIIFVKDPVIEVLKKIKPLTGVYSRLFVTIVAALLILVAFTSASVIRSLISDSQISFDVTNFFSLNIFSFLSFIILCIIILAFFNLSHILLFALSKAVDVPVYTRYVVVAVCAFAYLTMMLQNPATTSNVLVLVWLIIYMIIMEFRRSDIHTPILRSSFFIIWIIFFAASISALVIYQNNKLNEQKRTHEAEKLSNAADINAQYIFSTGISEVDSSFLLANLANFKNQTSNKIIKDSLSSHYLSINADAYETHIYTFDENDLPLYNDDSVSIFNIRNLISNGHETVAPDLYSYEKDINVFSFIYQKELRNKDGQIKGYFFIVGDPKKFKSQAVYPELFMPGNADEPDKNITYAIYNKGKLVESKGDYNFHSNIPVSQYPKVVTETVSSGNRTEFRYNAGNGKLLITIHNQVMFLEFVTLFAYLFGSFLLIIVLFQGGRLLVLFKFQLNKMRKQMVFNIKYQIQSAIVFISIFSFFVIGISTVKFYFKRFTDTNRERLIKSIKILSNEIEDDVTNHHLNALPENINDSILNSKIQKSIKDIAEIHGVDANYFDLQGNLQATTQPDIYKKQILSRMMNNNAYNKLNHQQEIQFIQNENVNNFSFLSIYSPIYGHDGKPYAYLNIPYLDTQKELNQEISNFLVTLINLNAFIFLIAGAISVLLTNRITNSFSLIADKMKKINLGTANDEIEWTSNDEIGVLVNEYNKMVRKLEDSATALAKSEREGAWREMARQVAHEIKNPLTPMKLSIQYMQKAIQENNPKVIELSKNLSATLVEQIDQLAKIASDFSHFANITTGQKEIFDINEVLVSLINLYTSNEGLKLTYNYPSRPILIKADRSQINRLFTNLFQNAIEASDPTKTIVINIEQRIEHGNLLITFGDEGSGIPFEKQHKIFTPNFTTKTSGTGLGLAISKGIVENALGKIWFTTEEGKGTTFHISLPIEDTISG